MNVHHFAWRTELGAREFRCWKCGLTSPVTIVARGAAETSSDRAGAHAAERARLAASENARAWIDVHLRFAACPRCGAHDEVAVKTLRRRSLAFALGGLVAIALGAFLCWVGANVPVNALAVGGAILALLGLVFAIVGALQPGMVLANAKRAVVFGAPRAG